MRRLRHACNYYFIAKAVRRKSWADQLLAVVPLYNMTTTTSKDLRGYLDHFLYFIDEETQENQRGQVTYPRLSSWSVILLGLDLRSLTSGHPAVIICWVSAISEKRIWCTAPSLSHYLHPWVCRGRLPRWRSSTHQQGTNLVWWRGGGGELEEVLKTLAQGT